jgi:hypothetical protein
MRPLCHFSIVSFLNHCVENHIIASEEDNSSFAGVDNNAQFSLNQVRLSGAGGMLTRAIVSQPSYRLRHLKIPTKRVCEFDLSRCLTLDIKQCRTRDKHSQTLRSRSRHV